MKSYQRGVQRVLTWHGTALDEGIALHPLGTAAVGYVVEDLAYGVAGTDAGTGINTLVTHAGLATVTVRVQDTLGSASCIGISVVLGQAGAHAVVAARIGAAGRGVARILRRQRLLD